MNHPEADRVVSIAGAAAATVRNAAGGGVVVPATAAGHAERAFGVQILTPLPNIAAHVVNA